MTLETEYDVGCACGNKFKALLYDTINISTDPHIIGLIKNGEFNVATCAKCGKKSFVDKEFVFHDMESKSMIIVKKGDMASFYQRLANEGYFGRFIETAL